MQPEASACLLFILVLPLAWVTCSDSPYENTTTGAILSVSYNPRPCMRTNNNNGYNYFRRKHILSSRFDTNSKQSWVKYLSSRLLCGRVPVQSFLRSSDEAAAQSICRGKGLNLKGNICISQRSFLVYAISSQKMPHSRKCIVTRIQRSELPVVVACDAIANQCLPVHYERYRGQKPKPDALVCR